MSKRSLPRITEPDENKVHYATPLGWDMVTICGLTDFLRAKERGKPTRKPVNCQFCKALVAHVYDHRRERLS